MAELTVRELVALLQKLPPDMPIYANNGTYSFWSIDNANGLPWYTDGKRLLMNFDPGLYEDLIAEGSVPLNEYLKGFDHA